jgi:hypothetical protein
MMIIIMIMGYKCKRGLSGESGISRKVEGKRREYWEREED